MDAARANEEYQGKMIQTRDTEIAALRQKLAEAETTIHRMCHGDADADRNYAS